jgi:hypothetical protein
MHGPAFSGDAAAALEGLGACYDRRLADALEETGAAWRS